MLTSIMQSNEVFYLPVKEASPVTGINSNEISKLRELD